MNKEKEFYGYWVLGEAEKDAVSASFTIYEEPYADRDLKEPPFMIGFIKWDGCSNWHFEHDYFPLGFCEREKAEEFGLMLSKLYEWAAELMPEHKDEILYR